MCTTTGLIQNCKNLVLRLKPFLIYTQNTIQYIFAWIQLGWPLYIKFHVNFWNIILQIWKVHPTKHSIFSATERKNGFSQFSPCKYVANMWKLRNKYRARTMVNATFAYQKTGVIITRPGENLCKSIFSSGESCDLKFPRSMNCYIGAIFM